MTPDRDRSRLEHIRAAAREAMDLIQGKERTDLDRERLLNLALVRLLEIVGEAAARLSPELRDRHPEVPWPLVVGLRNRLIHGYDTVNFDILWVILTQDLAPLVAAVDAILERSSPAEDKPRSA
jgi:uncharacterized protein with HEPN domain